MELGSAFDNGRLTVTVDGRLDSTGTGALEELLAEKLNGDVSSLLIDMTRVDFMSSRGLRVLVAAYKQLPGGKVILKGTNESVREVLRLSGLMRLFTLQDA